MIKNYIKPQTFIKQVLDILPDNPAERINAFVFGPAYQLSRYTNEEERAEMRGFDYAVSENDGSQTAQTIYPFDLFPEGSVVDSDFTKLYVEKLEGVLAVFDLVDTGTEGSPAYDDGRFVLKSRQEPNKIKLQSSETKVLSGLDGALIEELNGRPVQIGDRVYVENGSKSITKRTVVGFERGLTDVELSTPKVLSTLGAGIAMVDRINMWPRNAVHGSGIPTVNKITDESPTSKWFTSDDARYARDGNMFIRRYLLKSSYRSQQVRDFSVTSPDRPGWQSATVTVIAVSNTFTVVIPELRIKFTLPLVTNPLYISQITHDVWIDFRIGAEYTPLTNAYFSESTEQYEGAVNIVDDTKYICTVVPFKENDLLEDDVDGEGYKRFVTRLRIEDTSGKFQPQEVLLRSTQLYTSPTFTDETFVLGSTGVNLHVNFEFFDALEITEQTLAYGDSFEVVATAPSQTGQIQTLVLNSIATDLNQYLDDDKLKVTLVKEYNTEIPKVAGGKAQWTTDGETITINPDLSVYEFSFPGESHRWVKAYYDQNLTKAKFFVSARAFLPFSATTEIVRIRNTDAAKEYAGKIDPDNTLAYGLSWALSGAQGKPVFARRTRDTSRESFAEVLQEATTSDVLYAFCPMTHNIGILNDVKDHVLNLSTESKKRWRTAYVGVQQNPEYLKADKNKEGTQLLGTITMTGSGNSRLTLENADLTDNDIREGDLVRYGMYVDDNTGELIYQEQKIMLVEDIDVMLLEGVPENPSGGSISIRIYAANTGYNTSRYVAKYAKNFSTRRVKAVWCDSPYYDGNLEFGRMIMDPMFIAAEVAGIRTALVPQQGLTRTEVKSVTAAPLMYKKYTEDDLDYAAANGTFIITQDYRGSAIYIRHQLTTETDKGSLYYEDFITVNHDSICYGIKDILEDYIGKRNANYDTALEIYNRIKDYLTSLTINTNNLPIGSQIIGFKDLLVQVDSVRKDVINSKVTIEYALPINNIYKEVRASISEDEITIENQ